MLIDPMQPILKGALAALIFLVVLSAIAAVAFVKTTGLTARATPGPVETAVARRLRAWAVPGDYRDLTNPVLRNEESIRNGMAHFADHCAVCHANNGSGDIEMGRGLYPPPPDMRKSATQSLSDGELFYIIEHGVRFTGMPGWGTGTLQGEEASWHLVNFVRHLPDLTAEEVEELETMTPRSPAEIKQDMEAERFLRGDDVAPADPPAAAHAH
jgi:mono/diheme cytochrome c family protein